jgi:translation elongation factor P/translation initiation factor 5A
MRRTLGWSTTLVSTLAIAFAFAGASFAQTSSTTATRQFEVISADGNQLVFRDERGTHQITVPEDFRFTVDGKPMAIGDLKPGMKGTAVVTTTTTVTPVTLTEIKKGMVVGVGPDSVIVKDEGDGVAKRFTQADLNDRGIKILNKDGRVTYARDLKRGDEVTATIVSQAAPVVVTEQEVQATLAQANPTATTTGTPATAPATSSMASVPAPAPAPAPATTMATAPASAPAAATGLGTTGWVILILVIAVALYFFSRRRKSPQ